MTKAQKAALRHAYSLIQSRYENDILTSNSRTNALHGWLLPDTDPTLDYLNEAVCAALVVRGHMECRIFHAEKIWRYRITPEGCAAIGKPYPGVPSSLTTKQGRSKPARDSHLIPVPRQQRSDPHRFRRSSDWRRC